MKFPLVMNNEFIFSKVEVSLLSKQKYVHTRNLLFHIFERVIISEVNNAGTYMWVGS